MKKFITYGVELVDKLSPLNNDYYGYIQWFDGEHLIKNESETLQSYHSAWRWVEEQLSNIK